MKIVKDISLRDFEFWSGAQDTTARLTFEDLDTIEGQIDGWMGEEVTDTQINDFFWHDSDTIADILGYADWEDLVIKRKEKEEDEEEVSEKELEEIKSKLRSLRGESREKYCWE